MPFRRRKNDRWRSREQGPRQPRLMQRSSPRNLHVEKRAQFMREQRSREMGQERESGQMRRISREIADLRARARRDGEKANQLERKLSRMKGEFRRR